MYALFKEAVRVSKRVEMPSYYQWQEEVAVISYLSETGCGRSRIRPLGNLLCCCLNTIVRTASQSCLTIRQLRSKNHHGGRSAVKLLSTLIIGHIADTNLTYLALIVRSNASVPNIPLSIATFLAPWNYVRQPAPEAASHLWLYTLQR